MHDFRKQKFRNPDTFVREKKKQLIFFFVFSQLVFVFVFLLLVLFLHLLEKKSKYSTFMEVSV